MSGVRRRNETVRTEGDRTANPTLKYFEYKHLPAYLQRISVNFHEVAHYLDEHIPNGPENSAGLRTLLECKDCMVRASLKKADAKA